MKIRLISLSVILLISLLLSAYQESKSRLTLRWGLTGIYDELVVNETEITVSEWLEYIHYRQLHSFPTYIQNTRCVLKKLDQAEKKKLLSVEYSKDLLPDISAIDGLPFQFLFEEGGKPSLVNYRHGLKGEICLPIDVKQMKDVINTYGFKSWDDILLMPISGVSYQQALDFCAWRNKYEILRYNYLKKNYLFDKDYHEPYEFSLPSKEDFISYNPLLDSIIHLRHKKLKAFNYRNAAKVNRKIELSISVFNEHRQVRRLIRKQNPLYVLKHVQGNVSEMINNEGKSMGGGYIHYALDSYNTIIPYKKPEPWLGFRCVGRGILMDD